MTEFSELRISSFSVNSAGLNPMLTLAVVPACRALTDTFKCFAVTGNDECSVFGIFRCSNFGINPYSDFGINNTVLCEQ